ncbi:MAG: hypothetical protein ABIQ86_01355 [Steroidobacteraceae bacterium]
MKRALAWLALGCVLPAHAIDRIHLRAASIAAADMQLTDVDATLQLHGADRSTVDLRAARLLLPKTIEAQTGVLTALHVHCTNPVVREPVFDCPAASLQAVSTLWPGFHIEGKASFRSDSGAYAATGGGMQIAGAPLSFSLAGKAAGLQATLALHGLQLTQAKQFLLARKLPVPDLTYAGTGDLDARVVRQGERRTAEISLSLRDAGFQNAGFTMIGEKLFLTARATADLARTPTAFEMQITGTKGQALAGPVLLDFDKNPLALTLAGSYAPDAVEIASFRSVQRDLATVTGTARVALAPFMVKEASLQVSDIRFPAAYTSYAQLSLSTTPFNQLNTTGSAEMQVQLRDNLPTQLDLILRDLELSDVSRSLKVEGVNSELHWTAGLTGPPRPSWLAWENSTGWGIAGARSRLDFLVQDRDFRLTKPARLPVFDGAVLINALSAEQIGTESLSGVFDAFIEPISVAPIATALGLPEFAGKLSGRVPGLTYKDKVLTLQGNLEADVFSGHMVASNLRVREPLGAWPRLYGDVVARNLDLGLITSTFEFGSITGKLDVDLTGLETFNWTAVAFDLTMATPKGDRSRHRISQRAVQNLSDIGGGGGGVAAALQSGALKFFDEFGYDRIGLSCRLRNDICQMGGVGAAGNGFYIVKGKGLPRIDIIGNNQLVDWPRLLAQVRDALRNPQGIEVK